MSRPRRIIVDTDPGIDDAMAIFFALASPELEVVALTTVFGNAHTPVCTANALRLLEIAGRTDIAVAEGAHAPMAMPFRGPADFVHGGDGQGDASLAPPSTRPVLEDAVELIVDRVMSAPGEITLVPLGPLTNIARALQAEPRLAANLAGIVLMGGNAFCGGNATPAAEANVVNDPEAADIVFGAACPIVMAGLDVTERIVMTGAQLDLIGEVDHPRAQHLAAILPCYRRFAREASGLDGIHVHDSTTISYLLAPQHFSHRSHQIRVDTGHGVGRGKTWPRTRPAQHGDDPWAGRPPVTILTDADVDAVVRLELGRLGVGL
ncbi:MAG: nucleoside hydrolase [Acidimicrobiales bacterium]|nr:nucleoside hydrolase [Acidimicrobiales bacterium]MCB9394955.1 nucleoside hydrolase [Acidimicrobiaceae bacterium]